MLQKNNNERFNKHKNAHVWHEPNPELQRKKKKSSSYIVDYGQISQADN